MPEGHNATIEVCNITSFVLYTQILKQSVLKPTSPGITLSDNSSHGHCINHVWIALPMPTLLSMVICNLAILLKQEAQRATYRAPEHNIPPF